MNQNFFGLLIFLLATSCGYFEKPSNTSAPTQSERRAELQEKFDVNLKDLIATDDQATGWPAPSDCDGTLWCGMAKSVGAPCDLSLAEYKPGEIHRRPEALGECYNGREGGTVSNDMLLGYLIGEWQAQDQAAFERLDAFGEARNWTMGDGDATLTVLRPNGVGLLGRILYVLSNGATDKAYRRIPPVFTGHVEDYEIHLRLEGIMLNGAVNSALAAKGLAGALGVTDINDDDLGQLKTLAEENAPDAMAQAAYGAFTGDQTATLDLLLDPEMPYPDYVRGTTDADTAMYRKVYWLRAAHFVLEGK